MLVKEYQATQFFDGLYNPFMLKWGRVYYCFTHINHLTFFQATAPSSSCEGLSLQGLLSVTLTISKLCAQLMPWGWDVERKSLWQLSRGISMAGTSAESLSSPVFEKWMFIAGGDGWRRLFKFPHMFFRESHCWTVTPTMFVYRSVHDPCPMGNWVVIGLTVWSGFDATRLAPCRGDTFQHEVYSLQGQHQL